MATKKELMAFGKGQKQQVYRRGRVERSSAGVDNSLTGFTRADQAGASQSAEVATFLGEVMKTVPGAVDAWNKQENIDNEKRIEEGRASFKNANPKQRKKFRDAIWSGELTPDESPYFREGLQIAQTETLTHKYGPELFVAYENWEDKNSSDPQAFDSFIEEFNEGYRQDLNSIDDGVKKDHFWPKQTALISQLASQHQQKSAESYRKLGKLTESEAISKVMDSGTPATVDRITDERSLSEVLNDEAEKGGLLNNLVTHTEDNFLKKNPQPFVVQNDSQKELVHSLDSTQEVVMSGGAGRPIPAEHVHDSTAGILETGDILLGTTDNVQSKPKPNVVKKEEEIATEVIEKMAQSLTYQPNKGRDQIQLGTFDIKGAEAQVSKIQTHVTNKFDGKVNVYNEGGKVRIQFADGIDKAEQKHIQASIAKHVDYGYSTWKGKDKNIKISRTIKGES